MNAESEVRTAPSISGHMIDLGAGHSMAIYERNGVCWVAEFRDGRGEFTSAGSWFRLDAGRLRYRRATLSSATPLTPETLESIERLHAASEARQKTILALTRNVAEAARHHFVSVMSRLRGGTKISQTIG